jgi:hypothetical protein
MIQILVIKLVMALTVSNQISLLLVMKQQMQVFKFHWSTLVKTHQVLVNQISLLLRWL